MTLRSNHDWRGFRRLRGFVLQGFLASFSGQDINQENQVHAQCNKSEPRYWYYPYYFMSLLVALHAFLRYYSLAALALPCPSLWAFDPHTNMLMAEKKEDESRTAALTQKQHRRAQVRKAQMSVYALLFSAKFLDQGFLSEKFNNHSIVSIDNANRIISNI